MALLNQKLPEGTSAPTPDTLVLRDDEGGIEAGNFSGQGITVGGAQVNGFSQLNGGTEFLPASSSGIPITIRGAASQTGHLTDWKDINANVLSYVASDGTFN